MVLVSGENMQAATNHHTAHTNRIEIEDFCLGTTDRKQINAFAVAMTEEFSEQTGHYVTGAQVVALCAVMRLYSCYRMIPMWIRKIEIAVPSVMEPGIRFSIEVLSSQSSEFSTCVYGCVAPDGTLWQKEGGWGFSKVAATHSLKPVFSRASQ